MKNVHEPLLFKCLMGDMPGHEYILTCRDFAEITGLLKKYGIESRVVGGRPEGSMARRTLGFGMRVLSLAVKVPSYDVSLNHGSIWAVYASMLRHRKNITITDNDVDHKLNKRMFKHVDYLIIPKSLPAEMVAADNMDRSGIIQFDGYKEDIYVSHYVPDSEFSKAVPFKDFVTVRPESIQATYVPEGTKSIVPELLKELNSRGAKVLFLPRYKSDREYASGMANVHIPDAPLNGLDVCYHSRAVLTGAGTFAREAALLGTPAVSFYPGTPLLAVDQSLVGKGWMMHSRSPSEIADFAVNAKRRPFDSERSKRANADFIRALGRALDECAA